MNINPKYLSGSKNPGRRAQLIRQIADIYKKGKPYPSNLNALMKERDSLMYGGRRKFQPGGASGNPYAMPTSAATSGYTSNMSGMAGANQAALQLQQIQQEIMQNQQMEAAQAKQMEADKKQQFQQDIEQQAGKLATEETAEQVQDALSKRASRRAAKKLAKQGVESAATGNAAILAQANQAAPIMIDPAQAAGRTLTMSDDMLGMGQQVVGAPAVNSLNAGVNTGQVAGKVAGTAAKRAAATNAAGPIGAGMALVGTGVEHFSDDGDDTRTNFGEGSGRALKGAGTAVGLAGTLGSLAPALALGPLGLVAAGVVGGGAALLRQRKQKLEAREEEAKQQAQDAQIAAAEDAAFKQSMLSTGQDMGYNIGNSMTNSYLPGYQMQAGGSYMKPLPGGAVEFVGPKHSQGGIMLDSQTEVEGGETMDKVKMKSNGGKAGDYIFSDYLKLGGKTFATRHKELLAGGAKQKQIQELAKLQEQVAKREGRDENGPRDPNNIMENGGEVDYVSEEGVIPNPEMIDEYTLAPELAYARDFPEGQSRTDEGLYRRADGDTVTMAEVEALKANNPWYDGWDDFDPTDKKDVEAFQKAYNEKVPEEARIKVDGKVGEQTVSAYIPYRRSEEMPTDAPEPIPTDTPEQEIITQDTEEDTPDDTPVMDLPRERKNFMLPYQLMGPLAELSTKYPQPNKIAAPVTGRIKLPRVNYNAERAALAGSTNAATKFVQNQAAGPGAIASQMALVEKQRQGNIDLATQEARQNKQLAAQEAISNLQASQFDAGEVARARQFNAIAQNQRDQNEYEKRMLAYNQLGTNLAQFTNDARAYNAEERMAKAYQIDNEYDRQISFEEAKRQSRRKKSPYYGMNDMQIREEIARAYEQGAPTWNMQNQRRANAVIQATGNNTSNNNEETTTQKRGGYVRKLGRVRRRR